MQSVSVLVYGCMPLAVLILQFFRFLSECITFCRFYPVFDHVPLKPILYDIDNARQWHDLLVSLYLSTLAMTSWYKNFDGNQVVFGLIVFTGLDQNIEHSTLLYLLYGSVRIGSRKRLLYSAVADRYFGRSFFTVLKLTEDNVKRTSAERLLTVCVAR